MRPLRSRLLSLHRFFPRRFVAVATSATLVSILVAPGAKMLQALPIHSNNPVRNLSVVSSPSRANVSSSPKQSQGVDFTQPYASLKPRNGKFPLLVICFDPLRPGENRPSEAQIINQHRGDDNKVNVKSWYKENTSGKYGPDPITFLGCSNNNWFVAPPGRQGNWYWANQAWPLMWQDAIKAADPYFDFHKYDRNGDNHITGDELTVEIVRPQNSTDGYHRDTSVAVDGVSTPMSIDVLDVYFSANNDYRYVNVGLVAHEAAHGALGADDMYSGYDTRAGYYSLMDSHFNATHFDPFHKLKSGFLKPDTVEINQWKTQTVSLGSVETKRKAIILYHSTKKTQEYFILENRWGGSSSSPNYDSRLPAHGIAVWHIVEDLALANQFPPPGNPGFVVDYWNWGRQGIRFLGVLSNGGSSKELKWADGSSSKIKVKAKTGSAEYVNVEITKLP
ncbi:MAG TPA: hypothetical protein V6D14_28570 [Coleofasciculaceae cyanobacterium]